MCCIIVLRHRTVQLGQLMAVGMRNCNKMQICVCCTHAENID